VATTEAGATTQHLTSRCQFCDTWNRVDAARAVVGAVTGKRLGSDDSAHATFAHHAEIASA